MTVIPSATAADAVTLRRIEASLRPSKRVRPSEWAKQNLVLTREMGAERVGPYDPGYFPWGYAALDLCYDRPDKRGAIYQKMAQGGLTWAALVIVACIADTDPRRILYMMQREDHAEKLVTERWMPMVEASAALKAKCSIAAGEGRREIMLSRPFVGGALDFAGAGSPAGATSWTYPVVVLDEIDQAEANFPSKFGNMFEFALGRQSAIRYGDLLLVFSHPTEPEKGSSKLYTTVSDMGYWAVRCPDCQSRVTLSSELIHYTDADPMGAPLAESAELRCTRCAHAMTDQERSRIVWPCEDEPGGRPGGTGHVHTDLEPEQAQRRPYAGLAINGLCNPYKTLAHFATKLARAEGSEQDRRSVLNVHFGEPFRVKEARIDATMITGAVAEAARTTLPGGPYGVHFICSGTDVQAPRDNPTLVTWVAAYTGRGDAIVLALEAISGFAAWLAFHREFVAEVKDPETGQVLRMGISAGGIDDKWRGRQVKDACRTPDVFSTAGAGRIELVPMGFEGKTSLTIDDPWELRRIERRISKERPDLGAIPMYDLHRHSWMDRVIRRFQDERIGIACRTPVGFTEQMTANTQRPVKAKNSWDKERLEWTKPEGERDDWHTAAAYCEAVATIRKDLNLIHERAARQANPRAQRRGVVAPTLGSA